MGGVAVIAHTGKTLGGGLDELRRRLAGAGVVDPLWYEIRKSRKAPKWARRAVDAGVDLLVVWGGDGTVQRCLDAVAGRSVALALVPTGTANLLAAALDIPRDLGRAVDIGLYGRRQPLDVGRINGERFAIMAGTGLDARMIAATRGRRKRRWGRLAYVWGGLRHLRSPVVAGRVELDGRPWYEGPISSVLVGNIGTISGGVRVFPRARMDDGWLDVGLVTAGGAGRWLLILGRAALGRAEGSRWVLMARARSVTVELAEALPYQLDGGARPPTRRLDVAVEPAAVTICTPRGRATGSGNTSSVPAVGPPGEATEERLP